MTDDAQQPKVEELSWQIEISTEKPVLKTFTFKTRITAKNLETAFLEAIQKAQKMHEADPKSEYNVTNVKIA